MSSKLPTHQWSDWTAPSQNVQLSRYAQRVNHTNTISPVDTTPNHSTAQSKTKPTVSCKPLQWWSSLPALIRGILLGALLNILVLVIILSIWLTKPSAQTTMAPVNTPTLRWNTSGITVAGVTGVTSAAANHLNIPWDMVLDWSNTLYVTDRYNHRVQKFLTGMKNGTTIAGQMNGTSGLASNLFNQPTGIYVNSNDDIFISDANNNRVQRWLNGAAAGQTVAGNGTAGSGNSSLYYPYGIWRDDNSGSLYVADSYNHRIMRFDNNALFGSIIAGDNRSGIATSQLSFPYGFHFDSLSNSLLITNAGSHNVVRWRLGASNWTLVAGDGSGLSGGTSTRLTAPTDVTLDPMGNIYVADMQNHRIQFFSSDQSSGVTIAGITATFGSNATLLSSPSSIALDNQLNLYVVDQYNHRIQKFARY